MAKQILMKPQSSMAMLTGLAKIEFPLVGVYFAPMDTFPGNGLDLSILSMKS